MEKIKEVTSKSKFEGLFLNAVSPQMGLYFFFCKSTNLQNK